MKSSWAAGHIRWFIKFDIIFILKSDIIHFHCFTMHFNSISVMVQIMHLFVIKH
jgi:hypothetical protein